MTFNLIRKKWNFFFFQPIDPASIGIFRILFGILLLLNGIILFPNLLTWYSEKGVLTFDTAHKITAGPRINLLELLPQNDAWIYIFFCFYMIAALCLTLGLFTRLSAASVFLALVSFHHRNVLILNSGDTFLRVVTFFLIFSQAGKAYSLDWIWKVVRGHQSVEPVLASPWAQRMIQIQFSLVYFYTVLWKLQGSYWRDGTALHYISRLEEYRRFPVPVFFENLILTKLATWTTLGIELAMSTLIWVPGLRSSVLILALLLHLGIEYSMNIPLFEWIMIATLVLFIHPESLRSFLIDFRRLLQKLFKGTDTIFYDGDCAFCTRTVQIIHSLDLLGTLSFVSFRDQNIIRDYPSFDYSRAKQEMALLTRNGKWLFGYHTFRTIALRNPLGWCFAWALYFPGVSWVSRKLYHWAGARMNSGSCRSARIAS